ncbi:membrane bound O-acyl transferase family-domain-containing protein [Massariosphaeria phaeospora]|uniref:Membrane bound O-acyl transferase family-domain-containing protein n=1 Tax=Massariosphaeria phaeospora TaxID=100035 RepID=A0A7C8I1L9_9PLEO|nr:membrane bound O-acyl transferase family-domain-containing protein [Massariosphaeria phaeospora]
MSTLPPFPFRFSPTLSSLSLPPPPVLLTFQLLTSATIIGFTPPSSWLRPAALPLLSACAACIVRNAPAYMRPRWGSLLGGFSVALLLQYVDLGVISRWGFGDGGKVAAKEREGDDDDDADVRKASRNRNRNSSVAARFAFGWHALWSFRHINSPHSVPSIPPFSTASPAYVPPRRRFVAQQCAVACTCYILLDLLAARPPPANAAQIFNPALVPFFARLGSVTGAEIKLRALSIAGFAFTFYCVIQGFQSLAAAVAVGLGVSGVEEWRPAFGRLADAWRLKNVWGKFWHQLLRRPLTVPASALVHDVLCLPRHTVPAGALKILISFAISGAMHTAAGVASGMPAHELGVFRFFCTQAFGVLFEQSVISVFRSVRGVAEKEKEREKPPVWMRAVGFVWVAGFMAWSGPAWLYPQAARAPRQGATSFLPFSVVGMVSKLG